MHTYIYMHVLYVCACVYGADVLYACEQVWNGAHICVHGVYMRDTTYRLSSPVILQVQNVATDLVPDIPQRWSCCRLQPNKNSIGHASLQIACNGSLCTVSNTSHKYNTLAHSREARGDCKVLYSQYAGSEPNGCQTNKV